MNGPMSQLKLASQEKGYDKSEKKEIEKQYKDITSEIKQQRGTEET